MAQGFICFILPHPGPCSHWCGDWSEDSVAFRSLAFQHSSPGLVGWGAHRGRQWISGSVGQSHISGLRTYVILQSAPSLRRMWSKHRHLTLSKAYGESLSDSDSCVDLLLDLQQL